MKTALLLPVLLLGCVTNPDQVVDDPVSTSTATSELDGCVVLQTPPDPDKTWFLGTEAETGSGSGYGTGPCDVYTLSVHRTNIISATVNVFFAVDDPDAGDKCARTKITASAYKKSGSTWVYQGTESHTGSMTTDGCKIPASGFDVSTMGEARIVARASRTTCAGNLCGTQNGLPVSLSATPYSVSPPH